MKNMIWFILFCIACFVNLNIQASESVKLDLMAFKNPNQPFDNIITGGQPSVIDLDNLKQLKVKNIINLRSSVEFDEYDEVTESKIRDFHYISLEISGASDINVENATKLDNILKSLEGKTFLHCASSNRVGALLAIREFVIKGKTKEEAMNLGKAAGLGSLYKKTEEVIDNIILN